MAYDLSKVVVTSSPHIKADDDREYLIPAIPSVVIDTDVRKNSVLIRPMKGIFDDEN